MKIVLSFAYFGLSFLLALYATKTGQVFEAYAVNAVGAFLASMLGFSLMRADSYGNKHEIISAILSSCAAVFFCSVSFGIILIFRYAKAVI